VLWEGATPLLVGSYLVLTAIVALALVAAYPLSEWGRRIVTPRRLRAAKVLLVAGERDIRRARRHPALSDHRIFAIRGVFEPAELSERDGLDALTHAIRQCDADTVVLCCGPLCDRAFSVVVDAANSMACGLVSLTRSPRGAGSQPRLVWLHGSPLMVLASPASRMVQLLAKRMVDIVGAAVGLILTGPLLAVLALAIRLESPGPVLFGQRRIGAWGRPFRCLKFRTMRVDAEELLRNDPVLHSQYVKNNYKLPEGQDPRITRMGELLRKTSLDELPQFWNVLRGDMSLVGPRPVVPDELNEYGGKRRVLLSVQPGMSGAWAVGGRSKVGYPHRAAIELRYVRRWWLWADLSILWRTLPAVLKKRGAH
jgi:exopolysaccharide production protein ExoY